MDERGDYRPRTQDLGLAGEFGRRWMVDILFVDGADKTDAFERNLLSII